MIRINLLPAEMESAPTQVNPALPLGTAGALALLIVVPVHLKQKVDRNRLREEVESQKKVLEQFQLIIQQVDALEAAKAQLTQRKGLIQQLESERLRYPLFMDDFVKLLPGNLWLTNLTTVPQPAGNALTVNMDVTALDNYAIADFISNLETSQIFTDVELGTITAATTPNGPTMSFHLVATYRKNEPISDATKKS